MTPLPKRRHSTRRGGKRQAAIKLKALTLVKCSNCGALIRPHRVCPDCGFYKNEPKVKESGNIKKTKK